MSLPYKIATLLYCFNAADEVLLLHRAHEPNRGRWSPPGGKLKTDIGESPYACACREAHEEMGLSLTPTDLHLNGLITRYRSRKPLASVLAASRRFLLRLLPLARQRS
ncbi:MAG: NUDIX domain-containing protein [Proteobacteria bacterium]|nr:NUDIX domain-containing protein [Pseudomonadota bacterium]